MQMKSRLIFVISVLIPDCSYSPMYSTIYGFVTVTRMQLEPRVLFIFAF